MKNSSSSESMYYSPTNNDSPKEIKKSNIISCNCTTDKEFCYIFYFNQDTDKFDTITCKKMEILLRNNIVK